MAKLISTYKRKKQLPVLGHFFKKSVEGSTLIEVLIALVIIVVVFAMSLTIFNNVMYSGRSLSKIQVQQQLDVLAKQVQQNGEIEQETLLIDSILYSFKTMQSDVGTELNHLEINASRNGQELGKIRVLYKNKIAGE